MYAFCMQKLCHMYTANVAIQNINKIYLSFRLTLLYNVVYEIYERAMTAKFRMQNLYKSLCFCQASRT